MNEEQRLVLSLIVSETSDVPVLVVSSVPSVAAMAARDAASKIIASNIMNGNEYVFIFMMTILF